MHPKQTSTSKQCTQCSCVQKKVSLQPSTDHGAGQEASSVIRTPLMRRQRQLFCHSSHFWRLYSHATQWVWLRARGFLLGFYSNLQCTIDLCILAFHCLHGSAPRYLAETLQLTTSYSSAVACDLPTRRHWSFLPRDDGPLEIGHFQLWLLVPGILFRPLSETHSHCLSTAAEDSIVQNILLRGCVSLSRVAVNKRLFSVYRLLDGPATFSWQYHPTYCRWRFIRCL